MILDLKRGASSECLPLGSFMSRPVRSLIAISAAVIGPSCADNSSSRDFQLVQNEEQGSSAVWQALTQPAAISVAENGQVFIADEAGGQIHVYSRHGKYLQRIGMQDSTEGLNLIQGMAVLRDRIVILDSAGTRLVALSAKGKRLPTYSLAERQENLGYLGPDQIVAAGSAVWNGPAGNARKTWPLARVLKNDGSTAFEIGGRQTTPNPFVSHIVNFASVAGSRDGANVYLGFVNDPRVLVYSVARQTTATVDRSLPYRWKRIPSDFVPPNDFGQRAFEAPFDVVTMAIAADTVNRAFILTAISTSRKKGQFPLLAIDVLDSTRNVRRFRLPAHKEAIALGVSPDGGTAYVLYRSAPHVRIFSLPIN